MKAYKKTGKPFTPIIVELESQDEVDFIYALFNYTPISGVADNSGIDPQNWRIALEDYMSDYSKFHEKLRTALS